MLDLCWTIRRAAKLFCLSFTVCIEAEPVDVNIAVTEKVWCFPPSSWNRRTWRDRRHTSAFLLAIAVHPVPNMFMQVPAACGYRYSLTVALKITGR